jgi:predicted  nucleic acid-binding Zn-ribbon protein
MATLNGKTVKKVIYSPAQKEGATNETKTLIVIYDDDNQQLLNGGVDMLKKQIAAAEKQVEELSKRIEELNGISKLVK